eukprot:2150063-Pyramimonas_sp.AAC.1
MGGLMETIVMPETPCVISVGELCIGRGCSFHWKAGGVPRLLLPGGARQDLTVDGGIFYLAMESRGAL